MKEYFCKVKPYTHTRVVSEELCFFGFFCVFFFCFSVFQFFLFSQFWSLLIYHGNKLKLAKKSVSSRTLQGNNFFRTDSWSDKYRLTDGLTRWKQYTPTTWFIVGGVVGGGGGGERGVKTYKQSTDHMIFISVTYHCTEVQPYYGTNKYQEHLWKIAASYTSHFFFILSILSLLVVIGSHSNQQISVAETHMSNRWSITFKRKVCIEVLLKYLHWNNMSVNGCFRRNLVLIGQAASEKMSIKSVNNVGADSAEAHGGLTNAYPISSRGAFGSCELKSKQITVNLLSHDTSFSLLRLVMEFHKNIQNR